MCGIRLVSFGDAIKICTFSSLQETKCGASAGPVDSWAYDNWPSSAGRRCQRTQFFGRKSQWKCFQRAAGGEIPKRREVGCL